jgi:hypothetical protein
VLSLIHEKKSSKIASQLHFHQNESTNCSKRPEVLFTFIYNLRAECQVFARRENIVFTPKESRTERKSNFERNSDQCKWWSHAELAMFIVSVNANLIDKINNKKNEIRNEPFGNFQLK